MDYTINELSKSDSINLVINKAFLTDTSLNIIMDNNDIQCFDLEIKDDYENIIYENQNLYLHTTNNDTNQKVLRIDISKYESFSKNIKVKLNGKKIVINSEKNIYLIMIVLHITLRK